MAIHVINTKGLGISDYTGITLVAVISHNGKTYGLTSTGLLEFTGDDDSGTDIAAKFATGRDRFKSLQMKRSKHFYLAGDMDGPMYVKGIAYKQNREMERTYDVPGQSTGEQRNVRVKMREGYVSSHWKYEIGNKGGSDFSVFGAEAEVIETRRRV